MDAVASKYPQSIRLDRLRANEDYQPRETGIEERHVRLLEASEPSDWPPLLVTPNDLGGYDVVDGFHRLRAALRLGLECLPCVVDPLAGYPEGVEANLRHGLPLPVGDRKAYARWLHEQDPSLTYREIGRRTGLNHETVRRAIEGQDPDAAEAPAGENRQPVSADPIRQLVRQVDRAYRGGYGRAWLGAGSAGNPKPFRRALESYDDDSRPMVAKAMNAFGHACLAAAAPYLADADDPTE